MFCFHIFDVLLLVIYFCLGECIRKCDRQTKGSNPKDHLESVCVGNKGVCVENIDRPLEKGLIFIFFYCRESEMVIGC